MAQSQRINRINALLRRRQGVTMAQLMEDLSVSRATVNRDLDLMRDQLNAPITWNSYEGVYRLESENQTGPAYMLPGLWLSPQQAYAFLTMQNMVEKIAPNLLGPFLDPMRSMLKEMLGKADFALYGLDKKIDIDMPAMPTLGDLDFSILLEALLNNQAVLITLLNEAGTETMVSGLPVNLRIAADMWVISLRLEDCRDLLKIDVGQIKKVVAMSEDFEEGG